MFSKPRLFIAAIILVCLALLLYLHFLPPPQFKAVFLNVGQGDSTLIILENGAKILVDCGPNQNVLQALGRQLHFFDRQIDYLLITHPDLDHYGGCIDVLKRFKVKYIFTNGREKKEDPTFASFKEQMVFEQADIYIVDRPVEYVLDKAELKFYNPDPEFSNNKTNDNDQSLVFKFNYNTTTIFFTGDMESNIEKEILQKYCPTSTPVCPEFKSDYLKAGHHGSDSSSNEQFLRAVDPQLAIISVGKNKYGHPSQRVLKRLQRLGIEFLRTDKKGDIIVR